MQAERLCEIIQEGLPGARVEAFDARGDGQHWQVIVTSDKFEGQSRLERHRMVMATVSQLIPDQIHAIEIRPFAPSEA